MRAVVIIYKVTSGTNSEDIYKAPTLGQCFRRFFAERPANYEELIGWEVLK